MGENFHQPVYAEIQPSQKPVAASHKDEDSVNDIVITNGEDEPYTIKCICGFDDDAFDTVFCEQCNSWQHIACYYYPNTTLGPDAEHSCVDCNPHQSVNPSAAAQHQRRLRQLQGSADDRKSKKTGQRNHKKNKTRDINNNAIHLNGWTTHDSHFASPSNGSPRDSQPPAKRPKTTHKHSGSISNTHPRQVNGRHRGASESLASADASVNPPPKPPLDQCPPDFLSPRFIHVHRENTNFHLVQANMHLNITVTNLLSTWLDDQEEFAKATNGKTHSEVFQHFPQPIEELEMPVQKHVHVEPHVRFHGANPRWPYLSVDQDVIAGSYVGELRGCIGRREDYQNDPANQWDKLRHPNHFVFFHPDLPIYIDSRQEGTKLRYVRRSCQPNLVMKTIITGAREYRFCFTALVDIPHGAEITIPWDTQYDTHLQNALSKGKANMSEEEIMYAYEWVGTNLAHFGGCACEGQFPDGTCLLAHWDRRAFQNLSDGIPLEGKSRKRHVSKKVTAIHASHGTNSRESSLEAAHANHDGDVDMNDDRSTTISTKSSRDTTPHTNSELSEREKRKLSQLQRLFDQAEHNKAQPLGKKKKRDSGSNANTPTLTSQRQSVRPDQGASNPSTPTSGDKTGFTASKTSPNLRSPPTTHARGAARVVAGPIPTRPVYCDVSTQTESSSSSIGEHTTACKAHFLPRSKQLLKRSLLQNQQRNRFEHAIALDIQGKPSSASPEVSQPMDIESSSSSTPAAPRPNFNNKDLDAKDMDMKDVEVGVSCAPEVPSPKESVESPPMAVAPTQEPSLPDHPPIKPPPPPWIAPVAAEETDTSPPQTTAPTAPMLIDLPDKISPKPTISFMSPSRMLDSISESAMQPPPMPMPSPSISMPKVTTQISAELSSVTKPSPVKKKMSLSDYMNKRKLENSGDKSTNTGIGTGSLASPNAESNSATASTYTTGEGGRV